MAKREPCEECEKPIGTAEINGWTFLRRRNGEVDTRFRATWMLNLPTLLMMFANVVDKLAEARRPAPIYPGRPAGWKPPPPSPGPAGGN